MATDMPEKRTFPCEPATLEEISESLWNAAYGFDEGNAVLRRSTCPIRPHQIPWSELRFLGILGEEYPHCNARLEEAGMAPGLYISRRGDALVLIRQDDAHLQRYVELCGGNPEYLEIYNTSLSSLNVSSLTNLRGLDARRNSALSSLEGLENLTQLTSLVLSGCIRLTDLPGLENLTQLTSLDLSGCRSLTVLPGLENLTQLTSLRLYMCKSLTALPGLENLTQLTSLDLPWCEELTSLPGLENLTRLTSLNLSDCNKLTALPGLENLTQLTSLNLYSCDMLTALPGLENLTQLTSLDLSRCISLTALPGLENLTQLTSLNLSGCSSLTALPESIRDLPALRALGLRYMHLSDLPDWFPDIAEQFDLGEKYGLHPGDKKAIVFLNDTTVDNVGMDLFQQPYEMVVQWFEARRAGRTRPLNEIKVVFLGDGEAGKSHTIARLMNDGGDPDPMAFDGQSTPGIVIRNKEYDLGDRKIHIHYWDFGGQEIMHSMHRIFLTGRTMYVILLNARDDTQSDRAKYWLHNVKSFAPDAPVLLVLNKIDQNENASVDEPDLRGRYEKLTRIVRLSALKYSREQFSESFTRVLLEEIRNTGFLDAEWPAAWIKVKENLENLDIEKNPYIMGDVYQDICREYQVNQNQTDLLHWFNDLGVSFCFCDEEDYALQDYVILRPDWITNALYIILFNKLEGARNGLIPHASIHKILRNSHSDPSIRCTLPQAKYNTGDIQYVLGVMRKFNLSFTDGRDSEFIPMLCQQDSMVDIQYYHKDTETLEFHMIFDYLPNNLLHRLMVERYSELDMATVWRTGAKFILPGTGLSAVVVIDGNILRFFIRHTDPMHRPNTYLTMLKAHVERIVDHMGLQPPTCQLIYKLGGKRDTFDLNILRMRLDVGLTYELAPSHKKLIPIADILNQSAPESLEDEKKLLDKIIQACGNIQDDPIYCLIPSPDGHGHTNGHGMEDLRNRRIRDNLINAGYRISDQTQRGASGTRKSIGELDMLVCNDSNNPWTIIEALRVNNTSKTEWNNHLQKLTDNYNTRGFTTLYLLTYVDADINTFRDIWQSYRDHIISHNPGQLKYENGSFAELEAANHQFIKVARCRYSGGVDPIAVYHIFARIPTQNG